VGAQAARPPRPRRAWLRAVEAAVADPGIVAEVRAYLTDPNYGPLRLRLEIAQAAVEAATVEARRRVRLNEGRDR
jgi:hypothetical protein